MRYHPILCLLPCMGWAAQSIPSYEIEYADPADIPYICASYSKQTTFQSDVGGCYIPSLRRMVIPLGGKYGCIYWHEYRHMIHGDWHHGRPSAECNWRPTNP